METVDCVVVGAGVVGLAVARALALAGREVIVLDAAEGIGTETSSRNSEVIHAGIYYPKGSLMARFCVGPAQALRLLRRARRAARQLRQADRRDQRPGERAAAGIKRRAEANGVEGMRVLSGRGDRAGAEPALHRALLSPATGIVDSHGYMLALQGDAEEPARCSCSSARSAGPRARRRHGDRCRRRRADDAALPAAGEFRRPARPALARSIAGMPADTHPARVLRQGQLLHLSGRSPFSRLIYPVPVPGGLGVHLTIDLGGQARSAPTWSGSTASTTPSIRTAPTGSTPRCANTGRR